MDPFSFAPIAAILGAAEQLVIAFTTLLTPIAGAASAAVAIVVITLLIRSVLIPVGVSQVRAEVARRRVAPRLAELRRKYKNNPQLLQKKTMEVYAVEKISPFAGILPALAQAPVISLVYALFARPEIGGYPNGLLSQHLFGVPLVSSLSSLLGSGVLWPGIVVFAALLGVIAVVAWLSRLRQLRITDPDMESNALSAALSWLPFLTVLFAAVVPLAAALYLATSTTWTLVERWLLRRRFAQA